MFLPVTLESGPAELATDLGRKWTSIGKEYYQSDEKDGIAFEIRRIESGKFRWWLYDAKSADPETAVIESYDDAKYDTPDPIVADKVTLAEALAACYEYLDGYRS